jgi:hypothetical protein
VGEEGARQVDWDSPLVSIFSCFSTGSEVPKSPMMICERCEVGARVLQVESSGGKPSLPVAHQPVFMCMFLATSWTASSSPAWCSAWMSKRNERMT